MKRVHLVLCAGVILLGLAGAWLYFTHTRIQAETSHVSVETQNYPFKAPEGVSVSSLAPSLTFAVRFPSGTSPATKEDLQKRINVLRERLTKDTASTDDWLSLGLLYNTAGDYTATEDVWKFLTNVVPAPDVAVVYDNLGKLYKYNLKDFPASEAAFKKSIAANPNSKTPYTELFELYRYLYRTDTDAAVTIAKEAGEKFLTDVDIYVSLGEYYRDKGDSVNAKIALTEALRRAEKAGDVNVAIVLGREIDALPK